MGWHGQHLLWVLLPPQSHNLANTFIDAMRCMAARAKDAELTMGHRLKELKRALAPLDTLFLQ